MAIRITQAGVALTVGIIIVTGLIIGGLFWVKQGGEQARRDEAVKIAQQNLEEQTKKDTTAETEDPDKRPTEATPSENQESAPAEDKAVNPSAGNSDAGRQVAELPQTGIADQLARMTILALLSFSVASYVSSRRQA